MPSLRLALSMLLLSNLTRGFVVGRTASKRALSRAFASVEQKEETTTTRTSADSRPFFHIFYNDVYEVKLPPNHRFPMDKYRKVRKMLQERVAQASSSSSPSLVDCDFTVSPLATIEELATTHCQDYIHRFMIGDQSPQELRNVGFPWSLESVQRAQSSTGGTIAAACAAVEASMDNPNRLTWGAHVAGGTHHAFYDRGEGFSVFSDIAVAANVVLQRYPDKIRHILIVDLDVHQGNGNAVLFQGRPEVFTFSMQCVANYFSEKQQSDLDIELPVETTDETYLMTLNHWLNRFRREGDFDLIFFQAGVDVLKDDRLGRLALTQKGVQRRNQLVYEFAADLNVPMVITMGGGYPREKDWTPILEAHTDVYYGAYQFLAEQSKENVDTIGSKHGTSS